MQEPPFFLIGKSMGFLELSRFASPDLHGEPGGRRLIFHFAENPYFTNSAFAKASQRVVFGRATRTGGFWKPRP
jgi:hypothetical protein